MQIVQRFRKQKVLLVLLLAFVLLLGLTATTQAAPTQQAGGVYHTVRWGETLSGIARYYGTTTQAIMAANPQIWNPNLIFAGTVLFIPSGYVPPAPPPPPQTYCRYYHTVQYGDNLNRISAWYGSNPWSIAQANHIYNLNLIYAGQVLCIP
ncbi:MAG: LysM peptidoglycan-binding domain-containing protein [Ardenticatenaceae bacterium]|nr:LysM peptidoglycan-binding domain-containing protein [Ardenticatenaceae bacterium]